MGPSAASIVESILTMLTRLLSPLNVDGHSHHPHSPRGILETAATAQSLQICEILSGHWSRPITSDVSIAIAVHTRVGNIY